MTAEEQNVIDSFQGKEKYEKILECPSDYIFNPGTTINLMLPETSGDNHLTT